MNRNHPNRGFTLIELLVVIAIIAILAAILFPVFAQAKNAAKKTASLSNMKQIGIGLRMYWDENDGMSIADVNWDLYLPGSPTNGGTPYNTSVGPFTWSGWIQPYLKSEGIFRGPGQTLAPEGGWTRLPQNTDLEYANKGYGISVYGEVNSTALNNGTYPYLVPWNVDSHKNPSERIVVFEVKNNTGGPGGDNAWWVTGVDRNDPEYKRLAYRYNGGMNTLRLDSSAKYRSENDLDSVFRAPRARGAGDCQYKFYREIYYPWSADMSCTN